MVSVGASSYGATNPAFTIFDMLQYLYQEKLINSKIDVVSLGGSSDIGENFGEFNDYYDRDLLIERIKASDATFLYEKDFDKNIETRLKIINEKCKDVKLFVNIGGNSVGLGTNESAYYKSNGIIHSNKYKKSNSSKEGEGLIEKFLRSGVNVIQMLNLKQITSDYGLKYGIDELPNVGDGDTYYEINYSLTYPIIAIITVLAYLIGLSPFFIVFLAILSAMPTGSSVVMFAEMYEISKKNAAVVAGLSAILSMLTLPILGAVLNELFYVSGVQSIFKF
jgi:hypothetical protein